MPDELDKEIRDELRALPNDLADKIASHLVAAERALGDDDPELAYEHAKVARRFAARIGVVREAVGLAAYRAGQYAEALSDLRAARRLTGSDEFLPIMADCERGLGRPERALDLVRSPEAERLDRAGRIELAIVESGARRDLGQHDAAVITLQRLPELRVPEPRPWSARLTFAYADALAQAGHLEAATDWFERAMAFDEDGETEAAERYAELTGAVIEDVEELEDDESFEDFDDAEHDVDDEAGDLDALDTDDDADDDEDGDVLAAEAVLVDDADEDDDDEDIEENPDLTPAVTQRPDVTPVVGADEPAVAVADSAERGATGEKPVAGATGASSKDAAVTEGVDDEGDDIEGDILGPGGGRVRLEPGMAPAFIEPDFGDVNAGDSGDDLDDDDEPMDKPDKSDKRKP
ncbi:tetratricopeptide repeat protein [Sphaerisporangium album]|uniref:Tetratricopeptide repeat protein n=1 Tax=Sphaerisporangium album TaxID=509200 RepID=A0A367FGT5_9ACTN|nr:tetratricopeptide repeat protein [Sphaerisporangium album]RCG29588.1 tetratricopeptide repeat protein [Sphaerisporangium album]